MSERITPLPKRASNRKIAEAYRALAVETKGKLDNTTEEGARIIALLHDYCTAFANLYGEYFAQDAWDVIHDLEPELISKKKLLKRDFAAFTDVLRLEQPDSYYVFEADELYPDRKRKPLGRNFIGRDWINTKVRNFRYEAFWDLVEMKEDYDYPMKVLQKKEMLSWTDPDRVYGYPDAKELKKFFKKLRVSKNSKLKDTEGKPIKGRLLGDVIFATPSEKLVCKVVAESENCTPEDLMAEHNYTRLVRSDILMQKAAHGVQRPYDESPEDTLDELIEEIEECGVELSKSLVIELSDLFANFNVNCRKCVLNGWSSQDMEDVKQRLAEMEMEDRKKSASREDKYDPEEFKLPETEEELEKYFEEDFERLEKQMTVAATKGRVKCVPQAASDKEINEAYLELARKTDGRIDRSTPEGRQLIERLHSYFAAMANLYGIFMPVVAWDAIEEYEEELVRANRLRESDLYSFTDVLRLEQPAGYYVFDFVEIFPDTKEKHSAKDRTITSDSLVVPHYGDNIFTPFDILLQQQTQEFDFNYAILPKEELLEWTDPYYICRTPQTQKLERFLAALTVPAHCKKRDNDGIPVKNRTLDKFAYTFQNDLDNADLFNRDGAIRDNLAVSEKIANMVALFIQSNCVTGVAMLSALLEIIRGCLSELNIDLSDKKTQKLIDRIHDINIQCRLRSLRGNKFDDVQPVEGFGGYQYEYTEDDDDDDDDFDEMQEKIKNSGLRFVK